MRRIINIFICALFFAGCATTEVPIYLHDTTEVVRYERDSIFIDRWHAEYSKGDTVYMIDSVFGRRYVYKHDTTWLYRDVPVKTEVTVEVEKPLTWWQQFRLRAFWWLTGGMIVIVVLFTHNFFTKIISRLSNK